MTNDTTTRGFKLCTLTDNYGNEFTLQKSSIATDDMLWVGIPHPDVAVGPPWRKFDLPENAIIHSRAHITREQARGIAMALLVFAETGDL